LLIVDTKQFLQRNLLEKCSDDHQFI
jgi:hypothetical protein